jgi:folate-binding protein YgfZ
MLGEEGVVTGSPQLDALERGRAFSVLPGWRVIAVGGTDARAWLHDLVTADIEALPDRRSRRSLLLTPTGRIRADFHVAAVGGSFLLLQAPDQPEAVDAILRPYVLSSDVQMADRTGRTDLVAVVGSDGMAHVVEGDGLVLLRPSVLGEGHDLLAPNGSAAGIRAELVASGLVEVDGEDLETWRVRRGAVRMGIDFGIDALPAEAGLEHTIDLTKGCFLGQESVAKVRNLGHPPRLLLPVGSAVPLLPGEPVLADGTVVGEVTSAAAAVDGTAAIVRIRWDAASRELSTEGGLLALRHRE